MAKFLLTLFCAIALASVCQSVRYDGYKVYQVDFQTEEQFNMLFEMDINTPKGIMFWQLSHLEHHADIMVAPEKIEPFLAMLDSYGFTYKVLIEDFQKAADNGN